MKDLFEKNEWKSFLKEEWDDGDADLPKKRPDFEDEVRRSTQPETSVIRLMLVESNGFDVPQVIEIKPKYTGTIIGRRTNNLLEKPDIEIDYNYLSKKHICIARKIGGLTITDMESTNGTWLNGKRLEAKKPYPLSIGDHICLTSKVIYKVL